MGLYCLLNRRNSFVVCETSDSGQLCAAILLGNQFTWLKAEVHTIRSSVHSGDTAARIQINEPITNAVEMGEKVNMAVTWS